MKVFKDIYQRLINIENIEFEKSLSETDKLEEDLRTTIELKLILQNNLLM